MKKALIIRHGAYGDVLHCSHIPKALKEAKLFDYIAFETNPKGNSILLNNPNIDDLIVFDTQQSMIAHQPRSFLKKRWQLMKEDGKFDALIILQDTLERDYIAMEDMNTYYLSSVERREMYGKKSFYEHTNDCVNAQLHAQGFDLISPENIADVHLTNQETEMVEGIYARSYAGKFVIICNLSGSSRQKLFYNAEAIIKAFLSKHEDAVCITVGDEDCRNQIEFSGERIINRSGKFDGTQGYPFRQSMAMVKYADMAIGYESGLMIAANAFDVPTIQMMTTSSIKNHGGGMNNDYSMQSPAACSPCHKGPYEFIGCPKFDINGEKYPTCIRFNAEAVLTQMETVYANYRTQKENRPASLSTV